MNFLARLLRRGPDLDPHLARRLAAWQARSPAELATDFAEARYVVVDVESTGLDLNKDRLIAIGAVAVRDGCVDLADSFEVVLRQDKVSDKDNILIHGIGGEQQREGLAPVEAPCWPSSTTWTSPPWWPSMSPSTRP